MSGNGKELDLGVATIAIASGTAFVQLNEVFGLALIVIFGAIVWKKLFCWQHLALTFFVVVIINYLSNIHAIFMLLLAAVFLIKSETICRRLGRKITVGDRVE